MKWKRETAKEKHIRLTNWHEWFAWRPIRLYTYDPTSEYLIDTRNIVWCETVMRKFNRHKQRLYATKEDAILSKLAEDKADHQKDPFDDDRTLAQMSYRVQSIKDIFQRDDGPD